MRADDVFCCPGCGEPLPQAEGIDWRAVSDGHGHYVVMRASDRTTIHRCPDIHPATSA